MKKFFYTLVLTLVATIGISACTEETIQPADGGGTTDPCQFGGPNCPKGNN
jgi:hypothetical protein